MLVTGVFAVMPAVLVAANVKPKTVLRAGGIALAVPAVLLLGVVTLVAGGGLDAHANATTGGPTVSACGPVVVGANEPPLGAVTDENLADAGTIYAVARSLSLPDSAVVVADDAALGESRMSNPDYGLGDALGLFQEEPSQGWGTAAQVMDPVYAATAFFTRLQAVTGWQAMTVDAAAQAVENSANPAAYSPFVTLATRFVSTANGTATCDGDGGGGVAPPGGGGLPAGFGVPAGTPAAVVNAIGFANAQLGKPYSYGSEGPGSWDCSSLVQAAYASAGVGLPRTTEEQVGVGTPVYDPGRLLPGDLVFIAGSDGTVASPGHVGMFLGTIGGVPYVEHAPYTGQNVQADPLASFGAIAAMRRIISWPGVSA